MSAFESDISDEELRGGFDLGAPDDESFKLESLDSYPGVLPDFGIEEEPVIPIAEEPIEEIEVEEIPEEIEEDQEESVEEDGVLEDDLEGEGAFVDSDDEVDTETYDEEESSENTELISDDDEDFSGEFEDEPDEIEEVEDEVENIQDDEIEELSPEEIAALGGEKITPEEEELGDVDPELKTLLNSELERSKEIKDKKAESLPEDFDVEPEYEDFVPVEEQESDIEEIDITNIEADKLSTFGLDNSQATEESTSDQPKKRKKKRKKKRRILPLVLITVFVLLASVISLGIFKVVDIPYISTLLDEEPIDSTLTDTLLVEKEIVKEEKPIEVPDTTKKEEITKVDSLEKDSVLTELEEQAVVAEAPVIKVPDENRIVDKRPKKKQTKNIAKRNSTKEEKPKSIKVPKSNRKPESDIGLFTIQIYASPSKEDATEWLNKLQSESINDAFISEQMVRDEIWYRVRFGNFKTKQEAQAAALKLGYSQTWIDRVK